MQKITPFLWFDDNASEAVDFYLRVFPNAKRFDGLSAGGKVVTVAFELEGLHFTALNGGPGHTFNQAVSFVVSCADQAEIDRYWTALLAGGGTPIQCGWLKDRFGVRWQIVPDNLVELLKHPAAMTAMMSMQKFDIAALEAAAAGNA